MLNKKCCAFWRRSNTRYETRAIPFARVAALLRRKLFRVGLFGLMPLLGLSQVAAASAITTPIERFYTALTVIMKAGKTAPFRQRYDTLAPVIDRTFDLQGILESSVGPRWATLPLDQQVALKDAFRRYTIAIYVTNFDTLSGQRFEIQPDSTPIGEDQIVQTRILPASGDSHRLDYVMREVGGNWKVVDALADGSISRVAVQRSEMRGPLASGGAAALLERLQKKTAEMSGSAQLP